VTTATAAAPSRLVPAGLILLSLVPVLAGSARLAQPAAASLPLVVHIVSASGYAILGAFQFSPGLRRRRWHRIAGRVLVPLGLAVGLSALWLDQFASSGGLLYVFRLVFATAMLASLVLGFAAIRSGDVRRHRAWMTRAYAIALAAGTQVVTQGVGGAIVGTGELNLALLAGAGWVVNLAVAEWAIRRRPA
jgi:uncharacterized membrane protein